MRETYVSFPTICVLILAIVVAALWVYATCATPPDQDHNNQAPGTLSAPYRPQWR